MILATVTLLAACKKQNDMIINMSPGTGANTKNGESVTIDDTKVGNWWNVTAGFTYSPTAWKWGGTVPKLYWE